jgi:RHS repeat-associated protein
MLAYPARGFLAMYDATCSGGGRCFYRAKWQGSTTHLINQDGTIKDTYRYGPYGERVDWTPTDPDTGNPFRYTGRRFDQETGLYYYRARYYSPKLGRFLQTDPIGTKDDLNLYAYTRNDPLNHTDPSGAIIDTLMDAYEVVTSVGHVAGATAAYAVGVATGNDSLANVAADGLREARADVAIAGAAVALPFVSSKALHALKGASNIAENAAQGKKGEGMVREQLGDKAAGEQVTFKTSDGTTKRTDFVTTDKGVVEVKTGNAKLTPGQAKLKADIDAGRQVTPVGENARRAGLEPGKPTTMTSCKVERPC